MTLLPEALDDIRWGGERTYRCLSHYFRVRWNGASFGGYLNHALGAFEIPPSSGEEPNAPTSRVSPLYSLVDLGHDSKPDRRFHLLHGSEALRSTARGADLVGHLLWHINSEMMQATRDFLLIHSGAVVSPDGDGVLLPGASGAGKTTLVGALVREGFDYLSDEAAAIDPATRRLHPYVRPLHLKEGSFDSFPELGSKRGRFSVVAGQWLLRAEEIRPGSLGKPSPIRLVIFPEYVPGATSEVTSVGAAQSVIQLGRGATNLRQFGAGALALLASVVGGARSFRLVFSNVRDAAGVVTNLSREIERASAERRDQTYVRVLQ